MCSDTYSDGFEITNTFEIRAIQFDLGSVADPIGPNGKKSRLSFREKKHQTTSCVVVVFLLAVICLCIEMRNRSIEPDSPGQSPPGLAAKSQPAMMRASMPPRYGVDTARDPRPKIRPCGAEDAIRAFLNDPGGEGFQPPAAKKAAGCKRR